jgi:hypothetical protein
MSNLSSAGKIADESADFDGHGEDFDGHGENWQTGVPKLAPFCEGGIANIGEWQAGKHTIPQTRRGPEHRSGFRLEMTCPASAYFELHREYLN